MGDLHRAVDRLSKHHQHKHPSVWSPAAGERPITLVRRSKVNREREERDLRGVFVRQIVVVSVVGVGGGCGAGDWKSSFIGNKRCYYYIILPLLLSSDLMCCSYHDHACAHMCVSVARASLLLLKGKRCVTFDWLLRGSDFCDDVIIY